MLDADRRRVDDLENALVEERAKTIYASWWYQPGWVSWVERGNSDRQMEARRAARKELGV